MVYYVYIYVVYTSLSGRTKYTYTYEHISYEICTTVCSLSDETYDRVYTVVYHIPGIRGYTYIVYTETEEKIANKYSKNTSLAG